MRFFDFRLMGCLLFSVGSFANVPEIPRITEVDLNIEHVFAPAGFDENDDPAEIIVTGWYPNPCHEWSRAIVNKHPENQEINIDLKALVKKGTDRVCINMAVPFMESVKMGTIQEGRYKLLVANKESHMDISKATSGSIDDYIYGQVRHIRADSRHLLIEMESPSSCIQFDRFQTVFNGSNTCAILPIMKQVSQHCPRDPQTAEYSYSIPTECLRQEKVLFHIRSLEGKSVNFLYKNRQASLEMEPESP